MVNSSRVTCEPSTSWASAGSSAEGSAIEIEKLPPAPSVSSAGSVASLAGSVASLAGSVPSLPALPAVVAVVAAPDASDVEVLSSPSSEQAASASVSTTAHAVRDRWEVFIGTSFRGGPARCRSGSKRRRR